MNVEERQLIEGLFSRMRGMSGLEKDAEASTLINREAAANPDAVYLLTQSVLVQEQALQRANARIEELQAAVAAASAGGHAGQPKVSTGPSSFLGGGSANPTSTPTVGAGAGIAAARAEQQRGNERPARKEAGSRGGGGFMAQAMSTAAGVAGGMLLASGISGLFSGGDASAAGAGDAAGGGAGASETAGATEAASAGEDGSAAGGSVEQAGAEDTGVQDADMDSGDESWFDFGDMGDFEL